MENTLVSKEIQNVKSPKNKPKPKSNMRSGERIIYGIMKLIAATTFIVLICLLGYLFYKGIGHIDIIKLMPAIITTIYMVGLGLLFAVPIGMGCAIYLNEYTKGGKFVSVIRFANQCLTAVPSIIFGLFGTMFFVTQLKMGYSLLAGALTVAIAIIPTVVKTTEEALMTVPLSFREASLALGASKISTIWRVVIPSALPGILAGVVISMGRIIGETAAIYLTAGMVFEIPKSVMESGRTLSVHLYMLAKEGLSFEEAYGTAIVLLVVILTLNLITYRIGKKIGKK